MDQQAGPIIPTPTAPGDGWVAPALAPSDESAITATILPPPTTVGAMPLLPAAAPTAPSTTPTALLSFIRGAETSRGYEDYYRGSRLAPPKPVTTMTVNEVIAWQNESVRAGSKSSAVGGYQFIRGTLKGLVSETGLTGEELFDASLQDRLGTQLLKRRGFDAWQSGKLSDDAFMDNLANEWAALPTRNGRSRYAGDGLNAAGRSRQQVAQALAAQRSGSLEDLSGILPEDQVYAGVASGAVGRTAITDPLVNYTGADLGPVGATPAVSYISQQEQDEAAAKVAEGTPGLWEGFKTAVDEQWVATSVLRQMGKESFTPDPNFQFDDALWEQVSTGLPEDYQNAFAHATSRDHALAIAEETRKSFERDQKLGSMGWTGVGLQLGASILDPVAIAASALTEGMAAPMIYGAKATKISRFLRAGAVAGATNAGIDGYLISQDPVGKWDGIAYSAAAGFLLGGAVGAFRRTDMDVAMQAPLRGFIRELDAREGAGMANDGSMGAARNIQPKESVAGQTVAEIAESAPTSSFGPIRMDMIGRLKQSDNGITRMVAGMLDEDAVPNRDGSVSMISAHEVATRQIKQVEVRFYRDYNNALKGWAKETGKGFAKLYDPAVRAEFNNEIGKAVRRPLDGSENAHVQKVAGRVKAEFAELIKFGREHNIKGFDEFGPDDNYLTRRWNIQAIDDMMQNYGPTKVHQAVARALRQGEEDWANRNKAKSVGFDRMSRQDSEDVAKALLASIRSRKYGQFDVNQALAGVDDDVLRRMLQDEGTIAPDRIEGLIDRLTKQVDSQEKAAGVTASGADVTSQSTRGRMGSAKRRITIRETWEDTETGIKIEDMLDNNVENLMLDYTNSVIRQGNLERAFSAFKIPDADGNMPTHAPSYETLKRYISEENLRLGVSADKGRAELAQLDVLYRAVKGLPQEPEAAWRNGLRRLRSYNFLRVMGQVGVAQLSELGLILGNGGMRGIVHHSPMFRKITSMARNGTVPDALADEIESIWSNGTDVLRHSPAVRMEDGGSSSFMERGNAATGWQRTDYMLNQGKQVVATISGMSSINRMLQRMTGRVLVQRFLDNAQGTRPINAKRLRAMGIDDAMGERVSDQIRKHMGFRDGMLGKKATHINIENWDDIDAKNAFINGVARWSNRTIQENSPGSMPAFMTKEMGKVLFQFRSFMLGAYTKQLLAGVKQNDWEVYSSFMASMFFGGLFYVGQTHVNSIGRPDRDEWLDKRLSVEGIAKASFQRAGFSSVLPMIVDIGLAPFVDEPVFAYRTTDLSTGILGNPTVDLLNSGARALRGTISAASRDDYEFSQQNYRDVSSLVFLQNAFGIRNVVAAIGGTLPRFSQ